MKTYSKAELEIVRLNNNDIVTLSSVDEEVDRSKGIFSGDRMGREDWDAGY